MIPYICRFSLRFPYQGKTPLYQEGEKLDVLQAKYKGAEKKGLFGAQGPTSDFLSHMLHAVKIGC
jgi:hypothetical protein